MHATKKVSVHLHYGFPPQGSLQPQLEPAGPPAPGGWVAVTCDTCCLPPACQPARACPVSVTWAVTPNIDLNLQWHLGSLSSDLTNHHIGIFQGNLMTYTAVYWFSSRGGSCRRIKVVVRAPGLSIQAHKVRRGRGWKGLGVNNITYLCAQAGTSVVGGRDMVIEHTSE